MAPGGGRHENLWCLFFYMLDSDSFHLKIQKNNKFSEYHVTYRAFSSIECHLRRVYHHKRITSPITPLPVFVTLIVIWKILKVKVMVKWSRYRPGVAQRVGRDIALLFPWPRHQKGVSGQQHAPAALYPRERPGTRFTGGWVGSWKYWRVKILEQFRSTLHTRQSSMQNNKH